MNGELRLIDTNVLVHVVKIGGLVENELKISGTIAGPRKCRMRVKKKMKLWRICVRFE